MPYLFFPTLSLKGSEIAGRSRSHKCILEHFVHSENRIWWHEIWHFILVKEVLTFICKFFLFLSRPVWKKYIWGNGVAPPHAVSRRLHHCCKSPTRFSTVNCREVRSSLLSYSIHHQDEDCDCSGCDRFPGCNFYSSVSSAERQAALVDASRQIRQTNAGTNRRNGSISCTAQL